MSAVEVNTLTTERIKDIYARAAREQPHNVFIVSFASAVVSASDAQFYYLRQVAAVFIERLNQ